MTAWFRTPKRAETFSARIEGSLPGAHRRLDADTERLEAVVHALRAQGSVEASAAPREVFARDLRERLLAEAPSVLTAERAENAQGSGNTGNADLPVPLRKPGARERRLVAAAMAAVVLGGGLGVATASEGSLPGDTLYPVKRVVERADVLLSDSPATRGRDLLHQANHRLDEAQGLLARDDGTGTALVPGTLAAFTDEGRDGANLLLGDYVDHPVPTSVLTVRRFAAASLRSLNALSAAAPVEARPAIRDAEVMLADVDERASTACITCADLPALRLPPSSPVSAEVTRIRAEVNAAKLEHSRPVVAQVPAVRPAKAAPPDPGTAARVRAQASVPAHGPAHAPAHAPAHVPAHVPAHAPAQVSAPESRPAPAPAPAPAAAVKPRAALPVAPRAAAPSAVPSKAPVVAPSVTTVLKVPTVTKAPAVGQDPLPKHLHSDLVAPDLPAVKDKAGLPKTVLPKIKGSVSKLGQ